MRAGRLIAMLLALQRHGRLTAAELAAQLEVSPRTVLRDVEALSEAGVPVYAVPGSGGGIRLVEGFEARLSSLTAQDAPGLLLAGAPDVAAALGLEPAATSSRGKLLLALPPAVAASASDLDRWFLHDAAPTAATDPAVTRTVATALRAGWEVALHSGGLHSDGGSGAVRPLGLVLSAGDWYVVHLADDGPAVRSLSDVVAADVIPRPVSRPAGFDLARAWSATGPPASRVSSRRTPAGRDG